MENTKVCKKCGSLDLAKGRRICKHCNVLRGKHYYHNGGKEVRILNRKSQCQICNSTFSKHRKQQVICPNCYKQSLKSGYTNNQYKMIGNRCEHRVIAETLIKRKLSYNEVVHHIDENPQNNQYDNLWIMSRHNHGQLHKFLRIQRVAYEKSIGENFVNCWNILRVNQTTAWLETTGANVIKLIELGNQQPSVLASNVEHEGSETRDETSNQVML